MYTDLPTPAKPDSLVLTEIARMPLQKRAIALGDAVYFPSEFAAQLVASVANVPVWGEAAKRRFDQLYAEAEKIRAKEEKAARRRSVKSPAKPKKAANPKPPRTSANLFLMFAEDASDAPDVSPLPLASSAQEND